MMIDVLSLPTVNSAGSRGPGFGAPHRAVRPLAVHRRGEEEEAGAAAGRVQL